MYSTSTDTSSTRSDNSNERFNNKCMHGYSVANGSHSNSNDHVLHASDRINIMFRFSPHFFMEVLLRKMHNTVDKYASLNKEGTAILYTTRDQPKNKQTISLAEGKRIFEDLYGAIEQRWVTSPEFAKVQVKRDLRKKRAAKRTNKGA